VYRYTEAVKRGQYDLSGDPWHKISRGAKVGLHNLNPLDP
jgi:hypothetical protein